MILKAGQIKSELKNPQNRDDPLIITPMPVLEEDQLGAASIDLRLGCWFLVCRQTRVELLDVYGKLADVPNEARLTKSYYIPFGDKFILHPKSFVLGGTMEWIRLPTDRTAYVIGRSSWGRHGLNIATATGVHPGFTGCLTLELSNLGEIPITIKPGTAVCQIFIHKVEGGDPKKVDRSSFIGRRKPTLGIIELDKIAEQLANK